MYFKNKSTGLIWEVTDPTHIKRCQNDDNYEEIDANKSKQKTSRDSKAKTGRGKKTEK